MEKRKKTCWGAVKAGKIPHHTNFGLVIDGQVKVAWPKVRRRQLALPWSKQSFVQGTGVRQRRAPAPDTTA